MTQTRQMVIGKGWARTGINATIFRRNSIASDRTQQYTAYYDAQSRVILARRRLDSQQWTVQETGYLGNTADAHNSISLMVDGAGYLHMSWDHHVNRLRYCRSQEPGSLSLTDELPMVGHKEGAVTYPEFYRSADGNVIFLYRDGSSDSGDLILNHYDASSQTWRRLQDTLISGEGDCNAYW